MFAPLQMVVVADAELEHLVLGPGEALNKALEPAQSDKLLSHRRGHHTMFSADTNSPYWRLIRKGTAPAFKSENIKCALPWPPKDADMGWHCLDFPVSLCCMFLSGGTASKPLLL